MSIKLPVKRVFKLFPLPQDNIEKCSVSSFLLAASIARDVCCPAHQHTVRWKKMGRVFFHLPTSLNEEYTPIHFEKYCILKNLLFPQLPSLRLQTFLIPKMHLCCVRNACDERAYSCRGEEAWEAAEYIAILHFINSAPFFKSLFELE